MDWRWVIAQATAQPWWVAAITGSAGTLVVLGYVSQRLWTALEASRKEVSEITRESVTVITKILTRQEASDEELAAIRDGVNRLLEHLPEDSEWKRIHASNIDEILRRLGE